MGGNRFSRAGFPPVNTKWWELCIENKIFTLQKMSFSCDATEEKDHAQMLGRLVNHGTRDEINCIMKRVRANDAIIALCPFAVRDIDVGEELRYDYGPKLLPWMVRNPICCFRVENCCC